MNAPLMPTLPPDLIHDREGYEFIDGHWTPKTPDEPPEIDDRAGCEFIDGKWVEKSMGAEADQIGVILLSLLHNHCRAHGSGLVFGPECAYQIFPTHPNRIRKPDASFVARGRLPDDKPPRGNMRIHPDLAAEVISPNDLAEEINTKVTEYLSVGVRLVWVIYPLTKSAWVFRAGGAASWLSSSSELGGEDVVPGLAIVLDTLFQSL